MDYVSIDFETANSRRSSACALGIVVVRGGQVTEKRYWLIKPYPFYFEEFNTYIHGITENDVVNEPRFNEIWPMVKPYIEDNFVIAHNAGFDISVLRHVLDDYKMPYPEMLFTCTRIISKNTWPGLSSYKLQLVAHFLDIQFQHHDPVQDALAAALIFQKSSEKTGASTIDSLMEAVKVEPGWLSPIRYMPSRSKIHHHRNEQYGVPSALDVHPLQDHPFYQKQVVFTGTLHSMVREEAMLNVCNIGGSCSNSVTKHTNFLVTGVQDFRRFIGGEKSAKLRKAEDLLTKGQDIEIIDEDEFLRMLGER